MNNGWISVMESTKPESGEEVLVLSYAGDFPAPEDLFADPLDRAYTLCTYFYPGDQSEQEAPPRVGMTLDECLVPVNFDREGFYVYESGPKGILEWRYLNTITEDRMGIVCWKPLDWPTPNA